MRTIERRGAVAGTKTDLGPSRQTHRRGAVASTETDLGPSRQTQADKVH